MWWITKTVFMLYYIMFIFHIFCFIQAKVSHLHLACILYKLDAHLVTSFTYEFIPTCSVHSKSNEPYIHVYATLSYNVGTSCSMHIIVKQLQLPITSWWALLIQGFESVIIWVEFCFLYSFILIWDRWGSCPSYL